jgi:L-amino acid N-acyltransferase YncA
MIRTATPADATAIAEIYNHGVLHTVVTFEEEPVSPEQMRTRTAEILIAPGLWRTALFQHGNSFQSPADIARTTSSNFSGLK